MNSALTLPARARVAARRAAPEGSTSRGALAVFTTSVLVGAAVVLAGDATFARGLVALGGAAVLLAVAETNRELVLTLTVTYLVLLGFLRRLLIPFAGWSEQDPLLLVGPFVAIVLLFLQRRDRPSVRPVAGPQEALTPLVTMLAVLSLAQVFNPAQGGLVVGLQGLLFWTAPLLWFFVGRRLSDQEHRTIRRTALWLLVPVLTLGYLHSLRGPLSFELTWVGVSNFGASLFFEGFKIRPFSTLVSPQEYGFFLTFSLALVWSRVLAGHRRASWMALFAVVFVALVFQGTRTAMVLTLLMMLVTALVWYRSRILTIFAVAGAAGLVLVGSLVQQEFEFGDGAPWTMIEHQVNGLLHPSQTTGPIHAQMVQDAFAVGLSQPFGIGIGATSLAAARAGGQDTFFTAENDLATTFAALGPLGGVTFYMLLAAAGVLALRVFQRTRRPEDLATIGVLVVFLTQWWGNGMYAATTLLWLTVGWLAAKAARGHDHVDAVPVPPPATAARRSMVLP